MSKENFYLIHDEVIYVECTICGYRDNTADENTIYCPECEHDSLIFETAHEDKHCCKCNRLIDLWEDLFYHRTKEEYFICKECYNKLS